MSDLPINTLLADALAGDRLSLARLLSLIESNPQIEASIRSALAGREANAIVIGITGPPGAGKSTLISAALPFAVQAHQRVAVLAVDPSSPFTGGALLGDRVRMQGHGLGQDVFIRSMASRGESGGLARTTATAIQLLDACQWPVIVLETLGIGQVELDVMDLATAVVVVLNPGWGDTFQANKAGLTEAGDLFVINKADKEGLHRTRADLQDSLALLKTKVPIEIVETIAFQNQGIGEFWQAIERYLTAAKKNGLLSATQHKRRRRLLVRLLQRDIETQLAAFINSASGQPFMDAVLAGRLSVEQLKARFLSHIDATLEAVTDDETSGENR